MTGHSKGVFSLIMLSAVFAVMGVFGRYLSTDLSLFQQVYLRIFAALILSLVFFKNKINLTKLKTVSKKDWLLLSTRALFFYVIGIPLFTLGVIHTKLGNVAFIGSIPLVAVFGVLLLGEKMTWKKLLLVTTAFIGVLLISVRDYSNLLSWGRGEFFTLVSAVFFSLSYIIRKRQSDNLNNQEITTVLFAISVPILFILSLILREGVPVAALQSNILLAIVGAGFFNVINMFLTNYGFQKVEAILASNILTLESVFGVIFGFLLYQEIPFVKEIIGGILITLGVIGMNYVEKEE